MPLWGQVLPDSDSSLCCLGLVLLTLRSGGSGLLYTEARSKSFLRNGLVHALPVILFNSVNVLWLLQRNDTQNQKVCHKLFGPPRTCLRTQIIALPLASAFSYFIFQSSASYVSSAFLITSCFLWTWYSVGSGIGSPDHCMPRM